MHSQKGFTPLLLLILAAAGIIIYFLISSTFPFKDQLFSLLYSKPSSRAQEEAGKMTSQFLSNELLVKVKKEARGKVKEGNPEDTGLASLNKIFKEEKAKGFEKIAKAGKNSDTGAELFSWYKLTLDYPQEKAVGKLNEARDRIEQNLEGKENPVLENSQALFNLQRVIVRLSQDSNIETIDLNYIVTTQVVPNDPYYSSTGSWGQTYPDLWGIKKIDAEQAWDQTTGSASIIVADIDTGVDRNHEDLKDNMWVNTSETPNNGVDDDSNGYIDDYLGWDWANRDNDPMDDHGHGTHTVGTIAAVGNNGLGVVGVNWNAKIMALKFLNSGGSGSLDDGIKALQYAADMGARVSSNSWGCGCSSQAIDDAVKYEHDKGMVIVAAAGNSNGDAIGFSPANADYAITVAASDWQDQKASFSNWGEKIDVAAPGVDILSTRASNNPMCTEARTVGTNYCRVSGTSMATPHVAGLAALILSKNPSLTNEEVRQILRRGSDDLGSTGKDPQFGYGRINSAGSMGLSGNKPLAPVVTSPRSRTLLTAGVIQIYGKITGANFLSYKVEVGAGRTPTSWVELATSTVQPVTDSQLATLDSTQFTDNLYIIRLTTTDTSGITYQFQNHDIQVDNFEAEISFPILQMSQGNIDIYGSADTKGGLTFDHYLLEWSLADSPSWSTNGIILSNGGIQAVVNSKLGTWDTSGLVEGQFYVLRLTVKSKAEVAAQVTSNVQIDKDLVSGWPKVFECLATGFTICEGHPVFADIDNDGQKEIILTLASNRIAVYRKNGSLLPNFPVEVPNEGFVTYFLNDPNVSDLDNDGKLEIIASADILDGSGGKAKIYIIKSDGTLYPGWPTPTFYVELSDRTPAIGDLDNDGQKELVLVDWTSRKLHAYHLDGTELPGFPVSIGTNYGQLNYSGPLSVVDLNNDGNLEIMYPSYDKIFIFDSQGKVLSGWPYTSSLYNGAKMVFYSTAIAADLDGDNQLEIFAKAGRDNVCCTTLLYGWEQDGSLIPGWPKELGEDNGWGNYYPSPVAADIDHDNKDELIVSTGTEFRIVDDEGLKQLPNGLWSYLPLALGDVDGDDKLEIYGGRNNYLGISNDDGSLYWIRSFKENSSIYVGMGYLADMDGNQKMELAITVGNYSANKFYAYLWELPLAGSNPAKYDWPMFGHDPARTGRLVLGPQPSPLPTPTPSPSPTPTPLPTTTPSPTPIPTPTPSPTPPPDTQPPTAPTNLTAQAVSSSQINLAWTGSTDNAGVAGYDIYRDNTKVATVTTTSYGDANLLPSTTYSYFVKALDAAGNISPSSNTATATTPNPVITTGSIKGVVSSSLGGVLPGVKISTTVSGARKTTVTSSAGAYTFTNLPPGNYSLRFQAQGYVNQRVSVTVTSNQETTKNVTMVKR